MRFACAAGLVLGLALPDPGCAQATPADLLSQAERAIRDARLGPAWASLRRAYYAAPESARTKAVLDHMLRALDRRGAYNSGATVEGLIALLGKPCDDKREGARRTTRFGPFAVVSRLGRIESVADMRGLAASSLRASEQLSFAPPVGWAIGQRFVTREKSTTEFVARGQTVQRCTEIVTVERLHELVARRVRVQDLERSLKAAHARLYPETVWRVLERKPGSITYEARVAAAGKRSAKHALCRLIAGKRDIYRIVYTTRAALLPDVERDSWLRRLARADLQPVRTVAAQAK